MKPTSLLLFLAALLQLSPSGAAAQALTDSLLRADSPLLAEATLDERATASRSRLFALDADRLGTIQPGGPATSTAFELPLFDGVVVQAVRRSVRATGPNSWVGLFDLAGIPGGYLTLANESGVVAGKALVPGLSTFELRYRSDGFYQLDELDGAAFQPCGTHAPAGPAAQPRSPKPPGQAAAGGSARFDVLVVYTPLAKQLSGGTLGMRARIQAAMLETDLALDISLTDSEVALVGMAEVDYTESGDTMNSRLLYLTGPTEGVMDEIHLWRAATGADCVALITGPSPEASGLTWVWAEGLFCGNFPGAFSVTVESGLPNMVLAHELGHNFGCLHDPDNNTEESCGVPDWATGHRFNGTDGVEYRTIMAYSPGVRIPHYSNHLVWYQGAPTGIFDSFEIGSPNGRENARRIEEERFEIRDFMVATSKSSLTYVDFAATGPGVGNGSAFAPYRDLQTGLMQTLPGGEIVLRGAATDDRPDLVQAVRLTADSGPVSVGVQD